MAAWDDGPTCKVWTPSLSPANGDSVTLDGSEHWLAANLDVAPDWTYETRDTRRVIRCNTIPTGGSSYDDMIPVGPEFDRDIFPDFGWQMKMTFYANLSYLIWRLGEGYGNFQDIYPRFDHRTGSVSLSLSAKIIGSDGLVVNGSGWTLPDTSAWVAAWYVIGIKITADGTGYAMMKREADADNWLLLHPSLKFNSAVPPLLHPRMYVIRVLPDNPAAVFDIWKYEWESL